MNNQIHSAIYLGLKWMLYLLDQIQLRVDNCLLTSRINGLEKFSPLRVILSRKLDLDISLKIFKNCKKYKTLIFTQQKSIEKKKNF